MLFVDGLAVQTWLHARPSLICTYWYEPMGSQILTWTRCAGVVVLRRLGPALLRLPLRRRRPLALPLSNSITPKQYALCPEPEPEQQ